MQDTQICSLPHTLVARAPLRALLHRARAARRATLRFCVVVHAADTNHIPLAEHPKEPVAMRKDTIPAGPPASYHYRQSPISLLMEECRFALFRKLTRHSQNLFLRGSDLISVAPQVTGVHEPHIRRFIDHCADTGYGDFLIDIGANIGLTSCQSGRKFRQVHMFEPNPDCFSILQVNTRISLAGCDYHLHPYGLGDADERRTLFVPRHNWGGAFVRDAHNSYPDDVLAGKDGFTEIDPRRYLQIDIQIADARKALGALFDDLRQAGLVSGVIKIDVEGYEPVVIDAIARSLPADIRAMIVFECWDEQLDLERLLAPLASRASLWKIGMRKRYDDHWPRLLKLAAFALSDGHTYALSDVQPGHAKGDLVLEIH
ncbi:FkbM family methyltransferase [Cupriavidus pauculus]|uniref:FkbM family methyltransferase n=1 Tax=Cupriavidus pauculus TaxID=82633 RepID=UPI00147856A3